MERWVAYLIGYVISLGLGHLAVWGTTELVRRRSRDKLLARPEHRAFMPELIGLTERALYTTALFARHEAFIGLWLTLKFAGGWKQWDPKDYVGRAQINIFLIGNALSLLFAFIGFKVTAWLQ